MIRKTFMLGVVVILLAYTAWNFYAKAVAFDPLADVTVRKVKAKENEQKAPVKYEPGWSAAVHEKNVFSPDRTYREPKPVAAAPVEKPKMPAIGLKGIILDRFGELVAYIEIDKAKAVAMRKGDKVGGFELIDVSSRRAVVKWNDETVDLTMEKIKTISDPKAAK